MWFDAEINKNPEKLENLVTEDDVIRIAKIINSENDDYVCSRISFELGLSGNSGEDPFDFPSRTPLLLLGLDVLSEKFLLEKGDSATRRSLLRLDQCIDEIRTLINQKEIADILIASQIYLEEDINKLKEITSKADGQFSYLLFDLNKHKKQQYKKRNESWGKLGYYSLYLENVANLYTELSGELFSSDFVMNHDKFWDPITDGARFLAEFHKILNRLAEKYGIEPFTDKNLKNTSNGLRIKLNSLRKSEN